MIESLLVANRGEIARRIIRTSRRLGIRTVAVTAPNDAGALHASRADEVVEIAGYLHSEEHIRAAKQTGADAIHPGYGFLAESPDFARAVLAAGLTWIGPPPDAIAAMGDKVDAGDELRHRVLDLDAPVQLEEEEVAPVEHELGGAGAAVADGARERDGGRAHPSAQVGVQRR